LGLVSAVLVVSAAACAGAPVSSPPPSASASAAPKAAAVPADIVRSGTIVVGLPANPVLTTGKDPSGSPRGVAPDVINALAARMGVKVTWLDVTDNAKALRDIESGALDVLLISPDAAGADALAFVGYLEIDHTLLVPNGSAVKSFADADKPGVKIWVFKGAPVERTLGRTVKSAIGRRSPHSLPTSRRGAGTRTPRTVRRCCSSAIRSRDLASSWIASVRPFSRWA